MTFADKKGRPFDVKGYEPEDHSHLSEMYDQFSPKAKVQGLPPAQREACEKWISKIIARGENFIAIREGEVIGHSVLFLDLSKKDGEYMIFVNQGNRGVGVGNALTAQALEKAKELGIQILWLTVDAHNFKAIKLYRKFHFQFREKDVGASGRRMMLKL